MSVNHVTSQNKESLQKRHYFLLEQLQILNSQVPM